MRIHFLGTGGAFPSPCRGASSLALELDDMTTWLFDCGEGTQILLQKSQVSINRISKIFITHLHGDHMFGVPGVLATLSLHKNDNKAYPKMDIYGPIGLKKFIETALLVSSSTLNFDYQVHELRPLKSQYVGDPDQATEEVLLSENKINPHSIIEPVLDEKNLVTWYLSDDSRCSVMAGRITHRIPSFGYVIEEKTRPGTLNVEKLKALGLKPGPLYAKLKKGESVSHEDKVIHPDEVLGTPIPGRKLVICGDTNDASQMAHIARDCDILIHEATHDESLKEKAMEYGHSTPGMAAQTAKLFNTKILMLNHFSQRYRNVDDNKNVSVDELARQAVEALKGEQIEVIRSDDLMTYEVKSVKRAE